MPRRPSFKQEDQKTSRFLHPDAVVGMRKTRFCASIVLLRQRRISAALGIGVVWGSCEFLVSMLHRGNVYRRWMSLKYMVRVHYDNAR
ncbi:unnamed protein product, partial [Symbiodinium microadriaticum]